MHTKYGMRKNIAILLWQAHTINKQHHTASYVLNDMPTPFNVNPKCASRLQNDVFVLLYTQYEYQVYAYIIRMYCIWKYMCKQLHKANYWRTTAHINAVPEWMNAADAALNVCTIIKYAFEWHSCVLYCVGELGKLHNNDFVVFVYVQNY